MITVIRKRCDSYWHYLCKTLGFRVLLPTEFIGINQQLPVALIKMWCISPSPAMCVENNTLVPLLGNSKVVFVITSRPDWRQKTCELQFISIVLIMTSIILVLLKKFWITEAAPGLNKSREFEFKNRICYNNSWITAVSSYLFTLALIYVSCMFVAGGWWIRGDYVAIAERFDTVENK